MNTTEKYADVKVGDRVIVFTYWNTNPSKIGIVIAVTDHFVEIEVPGFLWSRKKELVSRVNIEVIYNQQHDE